MVTVGIRELKQNASAIIRRVKQGETLEVTERGRPVARLVPIRDPADLVEQLVAEGRATPPDGNLSDLPPPMRLAEGRRLPSDALAELRANER